MDVIDNVILLSVPYSLLLKTIKHAKILFEKKSIEFMMAKQTIVKLMKDDVQDSKSVISKINSLISKVSHFNKQLEALEKKRKKYERICILRIRLLENGPEYSKNLTHSFISDFEYSLSTCTPKEHHDLHQEITSDFENREIMLSELLINDKRATSYDENLLHIIICDFMLRSGYIKSARDLMNKYKLKDYVNIEYYQLIKEMIDGVKNDNYKRAIDWCVKNRSRLNKEKLDIEHEIYFLELNRIFREGGAIVKYENGSYSCPAYHYIQKNFKNMQNFQEIMTKMSIIIKNDPSLKTYPSNLFSQCKSDNYIVCKKLQEAYFKITFSPIISPLEMMLRIGLGRMKTKVCGKFGENNQNCPTCHPIVHGVSKNITALKRKNSILLCKLSGLIMNENNPPMMTPFGSVYSRNALKRYEDKKKIWCPRFKKHFNYMNCTRLFIV